MTESPRLDDYPLRTHDKLRYGDTDRQGHVNNVVFATLFETGRMELVYDRSVPIPEPGSAFVIARLAIDFIGELLWPGRVDIGTRVCGFGRSSARLEQVLFQNDRCAATAESVVVLTDQATRRSRPLPPAVIRHLSAFRGASPNGVGESSRA